MKWGEIRVEAKLQEFPWLSRGCNCHGREGERVKQFRREECEVAFLIHKSNTIEKTRVPSTAKV